MSQAMLYPERIEHLQQRKTETGYSCRQITDMVIDAGGYTSLGTVKKIFSADAKTKKFKDISLRPIEEVLGIATEPSTYKPTSNEVFYQDIIRELTGRLKANQRAHTVKNAAIVLLVAIQVVWLFIDVATPNAGWFGSDFSINWYIKLATLFVFCVVAAVYVAIKHRGDNE